MPHWPLLSASAARRLAVASLTAQLFPLSFLFFLSLHYVARNIVEDAKEQNYCCYTAHYCHFLINKSTCLQNGFKSKIFVLTKPLKIRLNCSPFLSSSSFESPLHCKKHGRRTQKNELQLIHCSLLSLSHSQSTCRQNGFKSKMFIFTKPLKM